MCKGREKNSSTKREKKRREQSSKGTFCHFSSTANIITMTTATIVLHLPHLLLQLWPLSFLAQDSWFIPFKVFLLLHQSPPSIIFHTTGTAFTSIYQDANKMLLLTLKGIFFFIFTLSSRHILLFRRSCLFFLPFSLSADFLRTCT